ncbi:TPA: hypothetical protein ACX6QF_002474 [Photobacterium damselae]|uniref:Uncharacterized protein n=1 Tax=Photobacterium damselae TaxID=38293 RepID=A0ACD3T3V5_PHODM|nr:hypothetical protein [Photobacterium damselae]AWK83062.1 hypothetical protein BST98_14175 [Photobacterium damselae]EHA1081826.1 hypothetical protein [Photobacterium damselae]ELI6448736.1 hypothetical protein [Photobacterium damselae]ELV7516838.1 hypothetical protein [Photobacterium damselae]MBA5684310.1 hypothetical protein [Photobacterium damselae subsp. damselae]
MTKSLCKYRRAEISDQFALISQIVSEPNYICSSCTRVASDKAYLCKPSALSQHKVLLNPAPLAITGLATAEALIVDNNIEALPQPSAVGQARLETLAAAQAEPELEVQEQECVVTKAKKLKKLAKKKAKLLKKTAKAVKKYEKALAKAKLSMGI